ncbi:FHA domain-containing protein [Agrococcus sp. ProA11]|uniref:FHA domain-containing protein n=1 Tax=Agrococcus chionoecetis TaxID=3153752 RepID=UPI003260011B
MSAPAQRAHIDYAPGEAWCVAAGRVVLVCERDLEPGSAAALHAASASVDTLDALRSLLDSEPSALTGLVDLDDRRAMLRRHGVPATAGDAQLDDRFGAEWSLDEIDATAPVEAGDLGALATRTLPLDGGVVRVSAVRVHPRTATFRQTLPPAAPTEAVVAPPAASPLDRGLIDSVPGFIKPAVDLHGSTTAAPPAAAPVAPALPSAPAVPSAPAADAAAGETGDHDGMTITAAEARRLQEERERRQEAAPATGPLVLSALCPDGHVNAPGSVRCTLCGAPVDERTAAQRARPEVAVAVLPSGERVPLGRGVVIGRRPRSRRVESGRVPRLATVDSPSEDVSRSHVELRVEDWNLVAIDLSSTNGTLLLREGAAPQRLRPEAATILQLGDRLDLGDAQIITVEAAP